MELFAHSSVHRWVLQRLGVYSIIRGALDRPSFSMTRQILSEGKRRLVVFPEGETIWLNGAVIPFQPGVIQLALKAYEDALKTVEAPNMYAVPIGIKYVYLEDMHDAIDASLARLEDALGLYDDQPGGSRADRLRRIAEAVLSANESAYGVKPDVDEPFSERMQHLKEKVISRLERQFDLTPPEGQPQLDRIRALLNAVDRIVQEQPAPTEYQQLLVRERQRIAQELYYDIWRALRFVAIYDGYVSESTTTERFLDVLGLLELEVFKRRPVWGPRKACVQIGAPVNLKDRFEAYGNDKRGVVHEVTQELESSVRRMLDALGSGCGTVRPSN